MVAIMTVTFDTIAALRAFNQYVLRYSSPVPLKGTLSYTADGTTVTEDFFLKKGENVTFSSYIDAYLDGKCGEAGKIRLVLSDITLPLTDEKTVRIEVSFQKVPVIAEKTFFFENERYRVGVELAWGGGLSYFADKKCTVDGLENLLNHFDTGRLVQQSYYGMNRPPYVLGEFMGKPWCYNPVQGGDRGGNKSKLVDMRIGDGEVYVKCRPRDWGHDGGTTYAYMENVYRLDGDCLVVDNAFTDYSGWDHQKSTQELPAFYTVSYLNNYYWYEGDKPWTGDALSCRSDLPFWPDDWNYCTFRYAPENAETWSAFADDGGYGIGLFTPGAENTFAGRCSYNGSKDPGDASTNYIAPTRKVKLICYETLRYRYLICAGQLEQII